MFEIIAVIALCLLVGIVSGWCVGSGRFDAPTTDDARNIRFRNSDTEGK